MWLIQIRVAFWRAVAEIKLSGYGKVSGLLAFSYSILLNQTIHTTILVHPDSDFECMGVLMEHTQDVKCVAWHPKEEVCISLLSDTYDFISNTLLV